MCAWIANDLIASINDVSVQFVEQTILEAQILAWRQEKIKIPQIAKKLKLKTKQVQKMMLQAQVMDLYLKNVQLPDIAKQLNIELTTVEKIMTEIKTEQIK